MHNNVGSFSEQGRASTQPINVMDDYSFDPLGGGGVNSNNGMYSMVVVVMVKCLNIIQVVTETI